MTQWGLDNLFNPGKRHMDDEKRRLQATREEVGDASGGRRIDLDSGKVSITPRAAGSANSGAAGSASSGAAGSAVAASGAEPELDDGAPADEDALTPDSAPTGDAAEPEPELPPSPEPAAAPAPAAAGRPTASPTRTRLSAVDWARRG